MSSLLHAIVQLSVEGSKVFVSAVSHLFGFLRIRVKWVQPQKRHIVLQVTRGASELANLFFNVCDLIEHTLFLRGHSHPPIERQCQTQTEPLDHWHGVHGGFPTPSVLEQLFVKRLCFDIQVLHVAIYRWSVES